MDATDAGAPAAGGDPADPATFTATDAPPADMGPDMGPATGGSDMGAPGALPIDTTPGTKEECEAELKACAGFQMKLDEAKKHMHAAGEHHHHGPPGEEHHGPHDPADVTAPGPTDGGEFGGAPPITAEGPSGTFLAKKTREGAEKRRVAWKRKHAYLMKREGAEKKRVAWKHAAKK